MRITLLLFGIITNVAAFGQKAAQASHHILAINGSWDLSKDPKRAQFVSGNKNIEALFINNFQLTIDRIKRVKSGFVELEFLVNTEGKLDSIVFIKHDDHINDFESIRLLNLTDGAWRPGQIEGKKVTEKINIRYYFSDNAKENDIQKKIIKAKELFDKGSFDNCIKYLNQALEINPFDTDVLKLKVISLLKLGKKNEACEALALAQTYYAQNIEELASNSCR